MKDLPRDVQNVVNLEPLQTASEIGVVARNGVTTLAGTVDNYPRELEVAAKNVVSYLTGVQGLANGLTIRLGSNDDNEKASIEAALLQNWSIDTEDIEVEVSNHIVTLTGTVNSVYQKNQAVRLAWNVPGIWFINDNLVIDYYLIDG